MDRKRDYTAVLIGIGAILVTGTGIGIGVYLYRKKYLSKNFLRTELTHSTTATNLDLKEQFNPPKEIVRNGRRFAKKVLQPMRNTLGYPVFISSWWRSPKLNQIIGGVSNSNHLTGEGVDMKTIIDGELRNDLIAKAVIRSGVPFTQLILEEGTNSRPKWIHLARTRDNNKHQILRKDNAGNYSNMTEAQVLAIV